jgi:glycosidase
MTVRCAVLQASRLGYFLVIQAVAQLLLARRQYPALCAGGSRQQLRTSDDSRFYAFLRSSSQSNDRMLVVLNFQPEAQHIQVDLRGHHIMGLKDIWSGERIPAEDRQAFTLPVYGYRIFQVD